MAIGQLRLKDSTGLLSNQLALDFVFQSAPAPVNGKPLVGASTSSNTTWTTLTNAVGAMQCRRTYEGGGSTLPATFASSKASADPANNRVTYTSFKPNADGGMATFLTSTVQQNWLRNYLRSVPVGHPFNIGVFHEPEDNIQGGEFTFAHWQACTVKVGEIVDEINAEKGSASRLRNGFYIMGPWTVDTRGTYAAWGWNWTPAQLALIDFVGIDPYNKESEPLVSLERRMTYNNTGSGTGQASSLASKILAWGKPVCVAEWGCGNDEAFTDAERKGWMDDAWAWMKAWNADHPTTPFEAALWFHYNLVAGTSYEFLGTGATTGLSQTLSKQAFIDMLNDAKT